MKIEIKIKGRHVLYIILTLCILAAVNYSVAQSAPNPGHTWDEISCHECVEENNIADNAITDAKISYVSWSKLTEVPSGLDNGDDTSDDNDYRLAVCHSHDANKHCTPDCPSGYHIVNVIPVSSYSQWAGVALCRRN